MLIDKMMCYVINEHRVLRARSGLSPMKVTDVIALVAVVFATAIIMVCMRKIDDDSEIWSLITDYRPVRRRSRYFFWG